MMRLLVPILLLGTGFVLARLLLRAFSAPQRGLPSRVAAPEAREEVDPGHLDPVDEQSFESFPASDPPSFTGTTVWRRDANDTDPRSRRTGSE